MPLNARPKDLKPGTTLPPIQPNAGMARLYKRKLDKMIREMHESTLYWVSAAYKANEPAVAELAADELSASVMERVIRHLTKRWEKNFKVIGRKVAIWSANSADKRVTAELKRQLEKYGWAIDFKMTRAMQDAMMATIVEQVGLIKSIPQKYFTAVQGDVMRAVQKGGDLGQLTAALQKNYGVTKRRAATIARDQNNKAFSTITQARRLEMGITEAIWMHSFGGKEPRKSHVKMNKQKFDIVKGMWDPAVKRYILPGSEINCRCTSRSVIPLE